MKRPAPPAAADIKLRLTRRGRYFFGPGKADLLRFIGATGSISAAAQRIGMSYHHAWVLVREMNADFRAPLVTVSRGGGQGGGAALTADGTRVLAAFDQAQAAAGRAARAGWHRLQRYI